MATASTSMASEAAFAKFYEEVKAIEKRDEVLTPGQQIDRLVKPGASYLNLNPFEVLQVHPDTHLDEVKKKFRRLSILVHPDKNLDDKERAQKAFDAVAKAFKSIEDPEELIRVKQIIEEARARTDLKIAEKRKKLKKEGKDTKVEEDDLALYDRSLYVNTVQLFIDKENKKLRLIERQQEEKKRQRELELEEEEKKKQDEEFQKNFEETREQRVNSWQVFQKHGKKKASKNLPRMKPEKKPDKRK